MNPSIDSHITGGAAAVRARRRGLRIGHLLALLTVLVVAAAPAGAVLPVAVDGQPLPSLAPMLERATPAVVNISASGSVSVRRHSMFDEFFRSPFFPRERRQAVQSVGSGVIIDADRGHVVTNHHVIENTDQISVTLSDGRVLQAELLGADPATDLAVLKVPARDLTALPVANSDRLRVGDFVVAIGNPFGLGQTVTSGIVSALGRSGLGVGSYEDFIQTDASINEGNSGGALVNLRGELVGVNSAIFARGGGSIGIGFAIPANMARTIVDQLLAHGEVRRGLLGIASQDLTPELAEAFGIEGRDGAVVVRVQPGSEAAQAGLRSGDVVVEFNGRRIRRAAELHTAIGLTQVGGAAELLILRDGELKRIATRIGEKRAPPAAESRLGERLDGAMFSDIAEDSPLFGRVEGVLIADVVRGSTAWRYGLRAGDVVLSVNRERVRGLDDLREAVKGSGRALMLNIARGSGSVFILIQ